MPPTRRQFLKSTGAAGLATAIAAAAMRAQAQTATNTQPRTVRTDHLDIGYEEHGNPNGTAVVLLHGFPFDVRSFDGVVAPLVAAGHRVLVPWLRGYGPTRFRDTSAPRMAQ
ncbi:MAG TPA: twin-arginine translocation signal domain-containing protein, partial [Gammaproteobacteria bacterium]|nr:twin-arginine translocation signal domain-containing protein [Gammaproteobacteria bacterium]